MSRKDRYDHSPNLHTQSPCNRGGFLFLQRLPYSLKTPSDTWHH
ncbi:hypothetical protein [Prochlorococcus sp. MIT 0702]